LIETRSTAVEEAVFSNYRDESNSDYRTKMRSLYLNLKGKENPSLREGVVSGDIPAKQLAVMTSAVRPFLVLNVRKSLKTILPQEMASEERKQKDKALQEENLFKSLGVGEQQAETDAFQCGRCKQVRGIIRQITFFSLGGFVAQNCLPTGSNSFCRRAYDCKSATHLSSLHSATARRPL
jgi:transcription elongation factor S-II